MIEEKNQPMANKIPDDRAEEAILSGEFQPKADQEIAVIAPDGTPGVVPGADVKIALQQGYKIETAFQQAVRESVQEAKKNPLTGAKIFGMQALDEALFGIPERVADETLNPFTIAKKDALKKEYQTANTLGGLLGFGASFVAPGANLIFKGATKAGDAATRAVGAKLADLGVKGSDRFAKKLIEKTAEATARGVTEGVIMTAPIAVTEASLGNPEAAAEALMLGGGLGAAFGAATGSSGVLFDKLKKFRKERIKIDKTMPQENAFVNEVGERTMPDPMQLPENDSLIAKLRADGLSEEKIKIVQENLEKFKPNAFEIKKAADELGLPVLEEQVTSDRGIQDLADVLSRRPTMAGRKKAEEYAQRFDTYGQVIKASVGDVTESSAFEVGDQVRSMILNQVEKIEKPLRTIFQDLETAYKDISVNQKSLQRIADNIDSTQLARLDPQAKSIARAVTSAMRRGDIKNLSDLKQMRTLVYGMNKTSGNTARIISDIAERMNNLEESAIDSAVQARIKQARTPGLQTLQDVDMLETAYREMQGAKKQWSELMKNLTEEGDALSLGNIKNPRDFKERLMDLPAETLVRRLFPKNDVASINTLRKQYPEQFKIVSEFERSKLIDGLVEDGVISPRKFATRYQKLPKEIKNVLFSPDQNKKIQAMITDLESLPKRVNPSGTSQALDIMGQFSKIPTSVNEVVNEVASFGQAEKVRRSISVEAILGTEKEINRVRTRLSSIPEKVEKAVQMTAPVRKAIDNKKTIDAINRMFLDTESSKQESLKLMQNEMMKNESDPYAVYNRISEEVEAIAEAGAPNVANALSVKMTEVTKYLFDAFPKPITPPNPFIKADSFKPSTTQLAKFERKLSVVMDPFTIVDALEDGSLTSDHVEAMTTAYPALYSAMRSMVTERLLEKPIEMSYQGRMKLSLFLGMNMDQSLSPESVSAFQNAFFSPEAAQANAAQINESRLGGPGLMKLGKNIDETFETKSQRLQKT